MPRVFRRDPLGRARAERPYAVLPSYYQIGGGRRNDFAGIGNTHARTAHPRLDSKGKEKQMPESGSEPRPRVSAEGAMSAAAVRALELREEREQKGFPAPEHEQVLIEWNGTAAEVDAGIAPLVLACWKLGLRTAGSCQGDADGPAWIMFWSRADAKTVAERVGGEVVLVAGIGGIDEVGTTWPGEKTAATVTLAPSSLAEAAAALEPDEER